VKFPRLTLRSALAAAAVVAVLAAAPAAGDPNAPVMFVDTLEQSTGVDTPVSLVFERLETRATPESIAVTLPPAYKATVPSATETPGRLFVAGTTSSSSDLEDNDKLAVVDAASVAPQLATCAPGAHTSVWQAVVGSAPGSVLVILDSAPGATKLTICLDALHAEGSVVSFVALELPALLRNPVVPSTYVWDALVTPYDATGAVAPASAYELRGEEPLPQTLTIKPTYNVAKKLLTIRGLSSAGTRTRTDVAVHILGGPRGFEKELGIADVVNGSYVLRLHTAKPPARFTASLYFYTRGCDPVPASTAPGGCLNESTDGAISATVKLTVVKPAKKKPPKKKH
jgi:hypothetical protein